MARDRSTDRGFGPAPDQLLDRADASVWSNVRLGLRTTPVWVSGLGLTIVLALVAGGGRLVPPLVIQYTIDHALADLAGLNRTVAWAVAAGIVSLVVAGIASWLLSLRIFDRTEQALAQLRSAGLDRAHGYSPQTVANTPSADAVSRLTADLDQITIFIQSSGVLLLVNISQMLIATVLMAYYSWPLALIMVLLAVALLGAMRAIQRVIARRFTVVRGSVSSLQSAVAETSAGIVVTYSTGTQQRQRDRVVGVIDRLEADQRRSLGPLHANTALGEIAISLMTAIVMVGGTWWAVQATSGGPGSAAWLPSLTAGELIAFIFLVTFFVRPLQHLVQSLGEAQNALTGWRRSLELVHTPSARVEDGDTPHLPGGPLRVTMRQVGAAYGDGPRVLHDVSVRLHAGEHVAIVGTTGSGKTTVAKLLTRQLAPVEGSILIGGVPLELVADSELERRVAIVPQDPFLFDDTIGANIGIGVHCGGAVTDDELIDQIIDSLGLRDWITSLPAGIDTRVGPRGDSLSIGERQLVALARTAVVDPDLLVLDEATSGVDPATDVAVQGALGRLTSGRTIVTIAHRLSTAESADRVLVMSRGRFVQDGTPAELGATDGHYARLLASWTDVRDLASPTASPTGVRACSPTPVADREEPR